MNKVVLARYKEDISWILDIPVDFKVIVYNKGDEITSEEILKRAEVINRPNIGRESETYIHHMMTSWENTEDYTVYSQADPFLHSPDFLKLLAAWRDWDDVQALSWCWKEERDVPPRDLLSVARASLDGRLLVRPELFSLNNWGPLEFFDKGARGMGLVYTMINGGAPEQFNIAAHVFRRCKLEALAQAAEAHAVGVFSYGAIFAARNTCAYNIPREALIHLRNFACEPIPAHGYMLERLWLHLMGAPFVRPKSKTIEARPAYELPSHLVPVLRVK